MSDVTVSPRQAMLARSDGGAVVSTLTAVLGPVFSDDDRCAFVILGHGALRVVSLDGAEGYTLTPETRFVGGSRLCAEGGGVRVAALSLTGELVVYDLARRAVTERTRLRRGVELLGFAGGRIAWRLKVPGGRGETHRINGAHGVHGGRGGAGAAAAEAVAAIPWRVRATLAVESHGWCRRRRWCRALARGPRRRPRRRRAQRVRAMPWRAQTMTCGSLSVALSTTSQHARGRRRASIGRR